MEIPEVSLQVLPVVAPRHLIDAGSRVRAKRPVRLPQTIDGHVVKERGEPRVPVVARRLAHAVQIA
jgi:hypothetical protein